MGVRLRNQYCNIFIWYLNHKIIFSPLMLFSYYKYLEIVCKAFLLHINWALPVFHVTFSSFFLVLVKFFFKDVVPSFFLIYFCFGFKYCFIRYFIIIIDFLNVILPSLAISSSSQRISLSHLLLFHIVAKVSFNYLSCFIKISSFVHCFTSLHISNRYLSFASFVI